MVPTPASLRSGNEEGFTSPRQDPRMTIMRRQTTFELPPTDHTALDVNFKRIVRRETLQLFLDSVAGQEPFPATLYSEPKHVAEDEETLIGEIESLFQCDVFKIPIRPIRRSSTVETPSRSSSFGQESEIVVALGGLTLGPADIPREFAPTIPSRGGGYGQLASSSSATTRAGPSRTSSVGHRPQGSVSHVPTGTRTGPHGEIIKPARAPTAKKPEKEKPKPSRVLLRLGCPMCKANPERYIGVISPCTDLKGITPTAKALMEHLKKQHSNFFRCKTCLKWHKNQTDLDKHLKGKDNIFRCRHCCREFKKTADLKRHEQVDAPCQLDRSSKPEVFDKDQEEAFGKMKNKSSELDDLEEKWRWCFSKLFPKLEKDSMKYWPYYDFAVFNHKLQNPPGWNELLHVAGGLRRAASPASPASPASLTDEDTEPSPASAVAAPSLSSTQAQTQVQAQAEAQAHNQAPYMPGMYLHAMEPLTIPAQAQEHAQVQAPYMPQVYPPTMGPPTTPASASRPPMHHHMDSTSTVAPTLISDTHSQVQDLHGPNTPFTGPPPPPPGFAPAPHGFAPLPPPPTGFVSAPPSSVPSYNTGIPVLNPSVVSFNPAVLDDPFTLSNESYYTHGPVYTSNSPFDVGDYHNFTNGPTDFVNPNEEYWSKFAMPPNDPRLNNNPGQQNSAP